MSGDLTADRRPFEAFWWLCKRLGLFWIARRLTRRRVRILCYHGFGTENEIGFRRGLFITPETFARRLDYVRSHHFSVVSLPDALRALDEGASRDGLTVITVDDVFFGFYQHAWPLLKRYGFPVTAYLTTYYARQPGPVFRLAIRFILWKTSAVKIDLSNVDERLHGVFDLTRASARDDAGSEIIALGESRPTEVERTRSCTERRRHSASIARRCYRRAPWTSSPWTKRGNWPGTASTSSYIRIGTDYRKRRTR